MLFSCRHIWIVTCTAPDVTRQARILGWRTTLHFRDEAREKTLLCHVLSGIKSGNSGLKNVTPGRSRSMTFHDGDDAWPDEQVDIIPIRLILPTLSDNDWSNFASGNSSSTRHAREVSGFAAVSNARAASANKGDPASTHAQTGYRCSFRQTAQCESCRSSDRQSRGSVSRDSRNSKHS